MSEVREYSCITYAKLGAVAENSAPTEKKKKKKKIEPDRNETNPDPDRPNDDSYSQIFEPDRNRANPDRTGQKQNESRPERTAT